jgi:8-oxo-dGTP diphosphatase
MDKPMQAKVGVGAMVLHNGKVLLGKRHEDPAKADSELHGEGTWTMPGGKLDFKEGLFACMAREVKEETSLEVLGAEVISVTDDITTDKHFVTVGFLVNKFAGEPRVMEPDEITEWRWFALDALPAKVFPPSLKVLKNYLARSVYKH